MKKRSKFAYLLFFSFLMLPGISLAQDALEDFDLSQIPAIMAGLSCQVVRFGIIAAGIAMVVSGIAFLLARGNPVAMTGAKNTFLYAIIGALMVYGVYTIVLSISLFVTGSTNLPWVPLTCS